jgi:adenylate cyclase
MKEDPSSTVQTENRRLAAIMFTDIVGFSRQMGSNEARTLRLLESHNQIVQQAVTEHHGHIIKTIGDAFLVDFPSVVNAVQCAQQVQAHLRAHDAEKESADQIHVRIGLHLGDIIQQDGDVFGDGVNIAKRLQELAEPDSICLSDVVYRDVAKKLNLGMVVSLGRPPLKNIAERFQVYALLPEPPQGVGQKFQVQRLKLLCRISPVYRMVVTGLVLVAVTVVATRYFSFPLPSTQHLAPSIQSPTPNPQVLPFPDKPSIVVLPFVSMSGEPEQEYFSDGITEVLTSDLSRISSLFVIARNSAFTYKGKATNVQAIGKELGVRYVLEGSVQKAAEQVRIVVQFVDTTTDVHLWSERFDRPFKDIFALQDEIVQKVVTTLKLQLSVQEQGWLVRKHTANLEAYDAYLRGMELCARITPETAVQARQMFEKAVALDPQYAEAYAWLSANYYTEWVWRWSTDPQTLERAFELAQKAVALDDSLPIAHSILSTVYAQQLQYDQAIAEGKRAITLDPNNALSYNRPGVALSFAGRPEEALPMMEKAMRLNPHYPPFYLGDLGWTYWLTGRYTEAVAALKETTSRSPTLMAYYPMLANSYVQQWACQQDGDAQTLEQALAAAQRTLALNNSYPPGYAALGSVHLWQKQYEQALAETERFIALAPNAANGYALLAAVLSRVGKSEDALRVVEQALRRKPIFVDGHLNSVGTAYALAGRPEEAVAPLKQYLSRYPNILDTHLTLAAVYSELGKEAEARAEVAEVLRINPKFSLEAHKERVPIKDPALLERHIAMLREARLK